MTNQVRVVFDVDIPAWKVEQEVIAYFIDPALESGSAPTTPTERTGWKLRSVHENFYRAMLELFELCCTSSTDPVQIDSIDLGPLDAGSQPVQAVITTLTGLTL